MNTDRVGIGVQGLPLGTECQKVLGETHVRESFEETWASNTRVVGAKASPQPVERSWKSKDKEITIPLHPRHTDKPGSGEFSLPQGVSSIVTALES